ncbi:hypothetical protein QZH41_015558 [Actinostola sp. cb2023]|nr:hypothetical protein QZH41_015558 [Actinostola sp. cb2023]
MASEQSNKQGLDWRLEKYVYALQSQVDDLSKLESKPNPDKMSEYTKRINFLKGLIETEKKNSINEKALASQHLARPVSHMISSSQTDTNPEKVHELHIKTKARIEKEMRDELMGTGKIYFLQGDDNNKEKEKSIDEVLQYHQNMQEKIADEMVNMARSLKHTSMMANNIILQDNKSLDVSTRLVDSNFVKLKHESDRLEEITSRYCSMWMWIALALVVTVFISTILFIRMFPKKQYR